MTYTAFIKQRLMEKTQIADPKGVGHIINMVKKLTPTLSGNAQHALRSWQHNDWESGKIAGSPELQQELWSVFAPVRAFMHERYGDAVKLYRGEIPNWNTKVPNRSLFSWTFDPNIADHFSEKPKALYHEITPEKIDKIMADFAKYGKAMVTPYRAFVRSRENPDYYLIYNNRDLVTDGAVADMRRHLETEAAEMAERNTELKAKQGKVYGEMVPIDSILWITNDLNCTEVIARHQPSRVMEDLDHSKRLLFHTTSWLRAGMILATNTLRDYTYDTATNVKGRGVSLTRSYAFAQQHQKGPKSSQVILVIDGSRLRTKPVDYWAHDPSQPDEAEEFHVGEIANLRSILVSINSNYMTFEQFIAKNKRDLPKYGPDAQALIGYLDHGYQQDAALWNRWRPVRGIG